MTDYVTGAGQTTTGLTLTGQDTQTVLQGGTANNTIISGDRFLATPSLFVENGGTAFGTIVQNGIIRIEVGGSATNSVVLAPRDGSFDNADIYVAGGVLTDTTAHTGSLYTFGGVSIGTKLFGDAQQGISSSAQVTGTVVNDGASQHVSIRSDEYKFDAQGRYTNVTDTVVNSGGKLILESGGVSNVTLNEGAIIDYRVSDISNGVSSLNAANVLTVSNGTYSFSIQLAGDYTGKSFELSSDGSRGTNIRVLCFCRDTLIATPGGQVAVQHLRPGDQVTTAEGNIRPVRWIGSQSAIVGKDDRPVVIHAGAFPDGTPHRDLRVTRGHSFVFGQVLIPIGALVNDMTVCWDAEARRVEIFHVELDAHAILLAEGASAESYRDDGNRDRFQGQPSAARSGSMPTCMPVVASGPIVDRTRSRLAERARLLNPQRFVATSW